ncbi:MAG TPA: WD40 repeat domain-containing protein, partial [Blastocatellia bacterium]|nr:WD40 repeat domain-containing protein [Blastocatellia bacterium]
MSIFFGLLKTFATHNRDVNSVAFSRDGKFIVSGGGDRSVRICSVTTHELVQTIEHGEWVNCVAFAPSGQAVASAGRDGSVKLWQAAGGALLGNVQAHPQNATCLTFSPDGSWIISGGAEGTIRFFNLKQKKIEASVTAHAGWVWRVALASKGNRLVTAGGDGVARIWKIGAKEKPITLEGHRGEVLYAGFSPDDQLAATAGKDGTVRVWSTESGACIFSVEAHAGATNYVHFSPDGQFLLTAGADNAIKLWQAKDGQFLREVDNCYDYVSDAVFSSDGKLMASCGGEGTVKLWDVSQQERVSNKAMTDPGLEIEVERVEAGRGSYSSNYASGKSLFSTTLSGGARISVLQGAGGKHSICAGEPPRAFAIITTDHMTIVGGDGASLLTYDLGTALIAYDSTGGAAKPFSEERSPAGAATPTAARVPGAHTGFTGQLDVERATDASQSRYKAFEKHGELLFTAYTISNSAIRLVKFDDDTIYVLFGNAEQPAMVVKSDYADVRDAAGTPIFRFSLESLSPVISRRALSEQAAASNGKQESGRDPLLVTSSADWMDESGVPELHKILSKAIWAKASDIHVPSGAPILHRQHGRLTRFDDRNRTPVEIESMLMEVLSE